MQHFKVTLFTVFLIFAGNSSQYFRLRIKKLLSTSAVLLYWTCTVYYLISLYNGHDHFF